MIKSYTTPYTSKTAGDTASQKNNMALCIYFQNQWLFLQFPFMNAVNLLLLFSFICYLLFISSPLLYPPIISFIFVDKPFVRAGIYLIDVLLLLWFNRSLFTSLLTFPPGPSADFYGIYFVFLPSCLQDFSTLSGSQCYVINRH